MYKVSDQILANQDKGYLVPMEESIFLTPPVLCLLSILVETPAIGVPRIAPVVLDNRTRGLESQRRNDVRMLIRIGRFDSDSYRE